MSKTFETKDSGQRVHFESGMQRDVSTDKPRVDLAIDGPIVEHVFEDEAVAAFAAWYRDGGPESAGALIRAIADCEGGLEPFFWRYVDLMKRGAEKYTDRNWMQANGEAELARFRESAARHFFQWYFGDRDEDHGAAVWFNVNGAEYVLGRLD